MSLEVNDGNKTTGYEGSTHTEVTNQNSPSNLASKSNITKKDSRSDCISSTDADVNGGNVFNVNGINPNSANSFEPSNLVDSSNSNDQDQKLIQNIVTVDGSLVNFTSNSNFSVISNTNNGSGNEQNNGTIYLLVSSNDSQTILQPVQQQQHQSSTSTVSTPPHSHSLSIVSHVPNNSAGTTSEGVPKSHSDESTAVVQVMNTDGIPVHINVNDVLASLQNSKNISSLKKDGSALINLSPYLSTLDTTANTTINHEPNHHLKSTDGSGSMFVIDPTQDMITTIPNWALHLRDCTLNGDTYTGYVMTEVEMDAVLNLYKKETQSLFAIRQTPSPAKDESAETVRLMWKSQYVPYDGIPFINVGRRATVMECEHGPRKRSNALKRMAAMSGQKFKKVPNLTCPARLFVKKVRKFPQYRVPPEADPKIIRGMQEHALKMVRSNGVNSGEIRLYMQLPLPTAHRYHHIGNSMEAFQKELANLDNVLMETISVDSRILEQLQTFVRQGYTNPFQVRTGLKEYVENKMEIGLNQARPSKHDKAFFPTLIEIQNMIQQAEAAIEAGLLTSLPTPEVPPMLIRPKRKRTSTVESPTSLQGGSNTSTTNSSSLVIKRMKIDVPAGEGVDLLSNNHKKASEMGLSHLNDQHETIALTLTDNQLEHFSVTNFTYDQLAQLAKIGLIALNNAANNGDEESQQTPQEEEEEEIKSKEEDTSAMTSTTQLIPHEDTVAAVTEHQVEVHMSNRDDPNTLSTNDGESILIVTPSDADEKVPLRIITTADQPGQPTITEQSVITTDVVVEGT